MHFSLTSLLDAASAAISDLGKAPPGMPGRIWDELTPWVVKLTSSATAKWLPLLTQALPCEAGPVHNGIHVPCTNHAIAKCVACKRPTCIHHGCSDQHGDVVCYLCVADQIRAKQGMPPRAQPNVGGGAPPVSPLDAERRVAEAWKTLNLRPNSSWEKIEERHKALMKKHHPDKFQEAHAKLVNEERFKAVRRAYDDLKLFYKKAEAA